MNELQPDQLMAYHMMKLCSQFIKKVSKVKITCYCLLKEDDLYRWEDSPPRRLSIFLQEGRNLENQVSNCRIKDIL